ncbi:MAG: hypothetical protein OSB09_04180, partial [Planctomycetota bacterium]|nr:hypothetical protein [Planctomycetota bacterium]
PDSISRVVQLLLLSVLLSVLLLVQCGCGILYKHRVETAVGTLWTNGNLQLARQYQQDLRWMKEGLQQVLPNQSSRVGSASILLGQNDHQRIIREDQIRTAGWYNHALSLIQFTPTPPAENLLLQQQPDPDGNRTLLHELAHHFTSDDPRIRSTWWIAEAVACSLEISYIDQHGQFQVPPLNPVQYQVARSTLSDLGRVDFTELTQQVISENWLGFYRDDGDLACRYAISWALFWTLQGQQTGRLEDRLEAVLNLEEKQILEQIPAVIEAITPSLQSQLAQHIEESRHRRWVIDQALSGYRINGRKLLEAIELELASSDPEGHVWAWSSVTRLLFRPRSRLNRNTRNDWIQQIGQQLESGPPEVQLAICTNAADFRWDSSLLPHLIDLLENSNGDLRSAAASALSRASQHPTIINPHFWKFAPPADRAVEIADWRSWLLKQ